MGGLAKVLKIYGSMDIVDEKGNKTLWVYDYANDKPRIKSEMTKEEILESEKVKFTKSK